eukprot:3472106-Amphidinium_carterae.1
MQRVQSSTHVLVATHVCETEPLFTRTRTDNMMMGPAMSCPVCANVGFGGMKDWQAQPARNNLC